MHPLLDGCEPELQKNLTAGLVLVSLHLELEHVSAVRNQISELLNVRSLWIPLNWGSHFPVFLMTSCATTPPRKAQSLGTFRKSTSSNRFFRSWNIGNHPIENLENGRNVKDHQKIENPAIVQKLLGAIYPVEICRCTWPVATSALARYIAATNRAILSNALVAASSSAPKLPMAPVAIFSTLSIPKFCTHAVGCKTDRFQSSD